MQALTSKYARAAHAGLANAKRYWKDKE